MVTDANRSVAPRECMGSVPSIAAIYTRPARTAVAATSGCREARRDLEIATASSPATPAGEAGRLSVTVSAKVGAHASRTASPRALWRKHIATRWFLACRCGGMLRTSRRLPYPRVRSRTSTGIRPEATSTCEPRTPGSSPAASSLGPTHQSGRICPGDRCQSRERRARPSGAIRKR